MDNVQHQVVMGFDFGLRRIGVAVGQTVTGTAEGIATLLAKQGEPNWGEVDKLFHTWRPQVLICGHPVTLSGERQTITKQAEQFARLVGARYDMPVQLVDERLSSHAAKAYLIESGTQKTIKSQIDKIAAKLIVETWLKER